MNQENMLFDMLNSSTLEGKEGAIAFSGYLKTVGLSLKTLPFFFKLFQKNIPESLDKLFSGRNPSLFFSTITPDWNSLNCCFEILISLKPNSADKRILLAILGLLNNGYKNSAEGMKLRPISISELQHVGKYLCCNDISDIEEYVMELLDSFSALSPSQFKELYVLANEIRIAYMDNSKQLSSVIPSTLLVG